SLKDNLLEYPQYTRPEVFMGRKVPEVLLSGHHAKIEEYRRKQSILRTFERRPDLLENAVLTKEEREYLTGLIFQKNYEAYE
ncbi:MAG: tRNA (guanosine(37)-N1)-methyltransferase TrmD, partial [Bacillota bacterium]|nr:tRNA (guanosine(37)-N1)-methyltransferase TrmD [Bacillota bacterium]